MNFMRNLMSIIFLACLAVLLVAASFGFAWAGGKGYEPDATLTFRSLAGSATVSRMDDTRPADASGDVKRGEIVRTGDAATALLQFEDGTWLGLDERTDVEISRLKQNDVSLIVTRGRIILWRNETTNRYSIKTNYTETSLAGQGLSAVNYDFRETVALFPIEAEASIAHRNGTTYQTSTGVEIHETEPVTVVASQFDPSAGVAAAFYAWFAEKTGFAASSLE